MKTSSEVEDRTVLGGGVDWSWTVSGDSSGEERSRSNGGEGNGVAASD